MHPVVTGSLWANWPLTSPTTTDEAPQLHTSARCAGAVLAATVRTTNRQTTMMMRPRFIGLKEILSRFTPT
jgi:hypothetical protein